MKRSALLLLPAALLPLGCHQRVVDRADRDVYSVIQQRQRTALGTTSDVRLDSAGGDTAFEKRIYDFVPRAIDSTLPESFKTTASPLPEENQQEDAEAEEGGGHGTAQTLQEATPDIFPPGADVLCFGLQESLEYAMRHARELQNAKEDLYLAALDLTLERHLWTPQFVASVQAEYTDEGEVIDDFDRAMTVISDLSVTQKLPFGGRISAQVINTLVRDLSNHVTSGETGNMILTADIPLFRGAGRVAYESRYVAERELVYAVRDYERFRRSFVVRIAADYFNLQQNKAAITNAYRSYISRKADWEKAAFIEEKGQSRDVFEASRAQASLRAAESALVSAKERYASSLDRLKIFIGMPVDQPLEIQSQQEDKQSAAVEDLLPNIDEKEATQAACSYRLDLLTSADNVDDARRGVVIARNNLLPDLDFTGSVSLNSEPEHLSSSHYDADRADWRGMFRITMDDRKTEQNAYRSSWIRSRRAQRNYEQFVDSVRADVRRAMRRVAQQRSLKRIQALNVAENERRVEAARAQVDLGKITNRDVVEAEDILLDARNDFAASIAAYRIAILEFRRDTGTLRVTDDGRWE